jgi:hypothetical protein
MNVEIVQMSRHPHLGVFTFKRLKKMKYERKNSANEQATTVKK